MGIDTLRSGELSDLHAVAYCHVGPFTECDSVTVTNVKPDAAPYIITLSCPDTIADIHTYTYCVTRGWIPVRDHWAEHH